VSTLKNDNEGSSKKIEEFWEGPLERVVWDTCPKCPSQNPALFFLVLYAYVTH